MSGINGLLSNDATAVVLTLPVYGSELSIVGLFFRGDLTGAFGVALISNLMNNLSAGLIGANALELAPIPAP